MKRILIYDVAAEVTGAATVLRQYYDRYSQDSSYESYFITSVLDFPENAHTHIIKISWTKRSRLHRLYCDYFYVHKLIKKYAIDEVIVLQNIALKGLKVPQVLYLHNAIPISDVDFDIRTERSLWVFKHIISRMIVKSLKYADKIIVQAEWIKLELSKRLQVPLSVIEVERVQPSFSCNGERILTDKVIFFYPAMMCSYKNHRIVVEACKLLEGSGAHNYEVVFTINPDNEGNGLKAQIDANHLPIRMTGLLNKGQMEEYYRKSVLLFPSYLETVGIPLVEAKMFGAEILAADLPYARETVGNYDKVKWFDYKDPRSLFELMRAML